MPKSSCVWTRAFLLVNEILSVTIHLELLSNTLLLFSSLCSKGGSCLVLSTHLNLTKKYICQKRRQQQQKREKTLGVTSVTNQQRKTIKFKALWRIWAHDGECYFAFCWTVRPHCTNWTSCNNTKVVRWIFILENISIDVAVVSCGEILPREHSNQRLWFSEVNVIARRPVCSAFCTLSW